jgi:protocatechuate 3,4-dioxygenase beta subunit
MDSNPVSRREMLHRCFGSGLLLASPALPSSSLVALWEHLEGGHQKPTPTNVMGPFYRKRAPRRTKLREPGDPTLPLLVSGKVWDTKGEALPHAVIQVWHADGRGRYDIEGYRYRAELLATDSGTYQFETVMPGHYPDRVAQHVHYLVTAPGHKPLITQLYFATDPAFEGDPDRNFMKDPVVESRELVRPVTLLTGDQSIQAAVQFDLCLERL